MDLIDPEIDAEYMREFLCQSDHIVQITILLRLLRSVKGNPNESSVSTIDHVCSHVEKALEGRGFKVTRERVRTPYLTSSGKRCRRDDIKVIISYAKRNIMDFPL